MTQPPSGAPSLLPILSVTFIGALGFSIVLPFLVFLVTDWGGNALVYGVIGATYSAFQLLGAPVLGRWSDRFGRRRILLLSQMGTLFSWLIFLLAFWLPVEPGWAVESGVLGAFTLTLPLAVVFLARAADGLTGGNVSVANAYLADVSTEDERSANFGKLAVASNLGFILGPAIAALLGASPWGELLPVMAAAGISGLASLIIYFKLPETDPCILSEDPGRDTVRRVFGQEAKPCFEMRGAPQLSAREILALPRISGLLGVQFLVMLGFNFFYVAFPVYAVRGLEWTVTETGFFFAFMGLAMALVQGPGLSWASKRLSDRALVAVGSLILAAGFAFLATDRAWQLFAAIALVALGNGLMWPSVLSLTSKAAGATYQGAVQGFAGSVNAIASILGLLLGGLLFATLGASIFLVSGAVMGVVFLGGVVKARQGRGLFGGLGL